MYKLFNIEIGGHYTIRLSDNATIPFDPANTDYQQFKLDLLNGVELQDIDGNIMISEQVMEFMKELP